MATLNPASIRQQLERTVGPAPWYWKTFPAFRSEAEQQFAWTHHGEQGPVGYAVSMAQQQEPDQLQAFDLAEIAGWFKQSSDRIYAKTPPLAEFEVPLTLGAGMHKIEVPPELAAVDELIVPTSYKAMSNDDPAFALFVFYLQAGLVEVLPQKWFTASQYQVGKQWISRAGRDQESHRIFGECFGVGTFLLEEDGCRLAEWI